MRLERWMCRFLLHGGHVVRDTGIAAELKPRDGETVLAFQPLDDDHELCGRSGGVLVADAVFLLFRGRRGPQPWMEDRPTFIAVECKTSLRDEHAFHQVVSTLAEIVRDLDPDAVGTVTATILTQRPAPQQEIARWKKRALSVAGVVVDVHSVAGRDPWNVRPPDGRLKVADLARMDAYLSTRGTATP